MPPACPHVERRARGSRRPGEVAGDVLPVGDPVDLRHLLGALRRRQRAAGAGAAARGGASGLGISPSSAGPVKAVLDRSVQLIRFRRMQVLARLAGGHEPGSESAAVRLFWSEFHKRLSELATDMQGLAALRRPDGAGYSTSRWQETYLRTPAESIFAGTSEIHRDLLAERVIGLPAEARDGQVGTRHL